ncbi:prokineticin-1-like [Tamandua tetradactyla]|uniref:prokineticin-1-like n=1 Tax=Tamandua tetradactyla TaxID=48850 RepID=UPI004054810A
MRTAVHIFIVHTFILLLLVTFSDCAIMTGACERDVQCGAGTCCAISVWVRGIRQCIPLGQKCEKCHPASGKVPFSGQRQHHTCPCAPNLQCSKFPDGKFRCSLGVKIISENPDGCTGFL